MAEQNKTADGFKIVGINLGVLAIYTILSRFSDGGGVLDAGFLLLHVLFCFLFALANKSWMWFLSGLLVLLIGVSTCVNFLFR